MPLFPITETPSEVPSCEDVAHQNETGAASNDGAIDQFVVSNSKASCACPACWHVANSGQPTVRVMWSRCQCDMTRCDKTELRLL